MLEAHTSTMQGPEEKKNTGKPRRKKTRVQTSTGKGPGKNTGVMATGTVPEPLSNLKEPGHPRTPTLKESPNPCFASALFWNWHPFWLGLNGKPPYVHFVFRGDPVKNDTAI